MIVTKDGQKWAKLRLVNLIPQGMVKLDPPTRTHVGFSVILYEM